MEKRTICRKIEYTKYEFSNLKRLILIIIILLILELGYNLKIARKLSERTRMDTDMVLIFYRYRRQNFSYYFYC